MGTALCAAARHSVVATFDHTQRTWHVYNLLCPRKYTHILLCCLFSPHCFDRLFRIRSGITSDGMAELSAVSRHIKGAGCKQAFEFIPSRILNHTVVANVYRASSVAYGVGSARKTFTGDICNSKLTCIQRQAFC